jgi:hypothetical protein
VVVMPCIQPPGSSGARRPDGEHGRKRSYSPVPPSASSAQFFQQQGHIGIRNCEGGWIDSRERRILEPPPKPSSQLKPIEPQRRLQERLEKPLALRRVEPRPALHRRFGQFNAPHPAITCGRHRGTLLA